MVERRSGLARWPPGWPGWNRKSTTQQEQEIAAQAGGKSLATLCHELLDSIDPDRTSIGRRAPAAEQSSRRLVRRAQEPTEEQTAEQVEANETGCRQALKPFHNPKLRDTILHVKQSLEQVIDENHQDELLQAGFDAAALEKAQYADDHLPAVHRRQQGRDRGPANPLQPPVSGRAAVPARQGTGRRPFERPPLSASPSAVVASVSSRRAGAGARDRRQAAGGRDRPGAPRHRPRPAALSRSA